MLSPRSAFPSSLLALLILPGLLGCERATRSPEPREAPLSTPLGVESEPAAPEDLEPAAPGPEVPRVVFLGDSLTAGLGLAESEAFPALLEGLMAAEGRPIRAVNAGVSGDTSAAGLRRLPWLLRQEPDLLVVALGANDGLRGHPVEGIEENLRQILLEAREAGTPVILLGIQVPPSYGAEYARGFAELYPRLAAELEVPLVQFLLEGVGGRPELNLPDGIHPNAEGHQVMARTVMPYLKEALEG